MHIVITNDDGYLAPGLTALHAALGAQHKITVVAPLAERSGCGHAATLAGRIEVRRHSHPEMGEVYSVDGTPVDCVRLAVAELVKEPIDLVIAGINRGANLGVVEAVQSGTLAAAREASFCGIGGIGISQMYRKDDPIDWTVSSRLAELILPQVMAACGDATVVWNVNLPAPTSGSSPRGVRVIPLSPDPMAISYDSDDGAAGAGCGYRFRGDYDARPVLPDTDVAALFDGYVVVTPLLRNPTDTTTLNSPPAFHL